MNTIAVEIQKYLSEHLCFLNKIREYYKCLPFERAIIAAAEAKNPDGKMNSHQYRIGKKKAAITAKNCYFIVMS